MDHPVHSSVEGSGRVIVPEPFDPRQMMLDYAVQSFVSRPKFGEALGLGTVFHDDYQLESKIGVNQSVRWLERNRKNVQSRFQERT
jgi:hypothetical protein